MMILLGSPGQGPKNPLMQILMAIIGLVALGLAFAFSLVFFAVLMVIGLGYGLYFWWKTRAVRKVMREQMSQMQRDTQYPGDESETMIIEGEAVRVSDDAGEDSGHA